MSRTARIAKFSTFSVLFLLASCGGGGGGDESGGGSSNVAPTASASASPTSGVVPLTVSFDGTGSADSDGSIASYSWNFNDGDSATGATASHTFTDVGVYTVVLTVTDDDGLSDTDSVTVTVGENAPPTAVVATDKTSGDAPLTVNFDGSGSTDNDGSISSYSWDFGDGNSGSSATESNTYSSAGSYTATLTVTDDKGVTDTDSVQIDVSSAATYRISGSFRAVGGTFADSDVNDPYAPYASNDFVGEEQQLMTPVTAGGFVSAVGTGGGPNGDDRFADAGDEWDLYRAQLVAGQSITLSISDWDELDHAANDLDLYIYDATSPYPLLDSSAGYNILETITVDQALVDASTNGEVIIEVHAYNGISNYSLVISDAEAPAVAMEYSLNFGNGFIPNEAIVFMNDTARDKNAQDVAQKAASLGMVVKAGAPGRAILFAPDKTNTTTKFKPEQPTHHRTLHALTDARSRAMLDTIAMVKDLRVRDDVATAGLNYVYQPLYTPNDPQYVNQWHYNMIYLPQAWDVTTGDANVIVAVADTGVFLAHDDLAANLIAGYDFIRSTAMSNDGDGIDSNADDPGDKATPGSSSWHGTHVAGTVAAASNNAKGIAGTAGGVKIMPLRVLGIGGGTGYDIIQSVYYAAGLPNDSGSVPAQPADIINLSLGCQGCYDSSSATAYHQARSAGMIIVAAAGNDNSSQLGYPASYDGVISVSSVRPDRARAHYSNFGAEIDVAAPGGDQSLGYTSGVLSTYVDDVTGARLATYKYLQGTSMAAPHVAGVVALMKSVYPGLAPDEVDSLLETGQITQDIGAAGRDDYFGHGLIDARKAVEAAMALDAGTAPAPSTLVLDVALLNLGSATTTTLVTLDKTGSDALTVTGATSNANWLSIAPATIGAEGLGTYQLSVDRAGLADSVYQGRVTFTASNGSSVFVQVSMTVGSGTGAGDAGLTYVLLIDLATNQSVGQAQGTAVSGVYEYLFDAVPAGSYAVIAGTDMDNDYFICDDGEACGMYPTLGSPAPVTLGQDNDNLDFLINFDVRITGSSAELEPVTGYRRGN